MDKVLEWFKGKKTYFVALFIVLGTIAEQFLNVGVPEWVYLILGALGITTIRAGIADFRKNISESSDNGSD